MIINHNHPDWLAIWNKDTPARQDNKWNGAYYYSREICDNIIPLVRTDRHWMTIDLVNNGMDHSIIFAHNNVRTERYDYLRRNDDVILVCGLPETAEKLRPIARAIYLPLSVDVEYVKSFKVKRKTKDTAYVGRRRKIREILGTSLPEDIDYLCNLPREELLAEMAKYKNVYAVGRTAIEAKILGCNVLPYDPRFPDPERWEILDNKEAAAILQQKLDEIDRPMGQNMQTPTEKADIVYVISNGYDRPELRYSLRTVCKNFPHNKVWIYGDCPEDIKPDGFVHVDQFGSSRYEKVRNMLKLVCMNTDITQDFWLFNDDFFINKKPDSLEPLCLGSLAVHAQKLERKYGGETKYSSQLKETARYLKTRGLDRLDYEAHTPMLFNREKLLETIDSFPYCPMIRSLYGNLHRIGGDLRDDVKYHAATDEIDPESVFISGSNAAWDGSLGEYIKGKYKTRCKYETK